MEDYKISLLDEDGLGPRKIWTNFCNENDLRSWDETHSILYNKYNAVCSRKTFVWFEDKKRLSSLFA